MIKVNNLHGTIQRALAEIINKTGALPVHPSTIHDWWPVVGGPFGLDIEAIRVMWCSRPPGQPQNWDANISGPIEIHPQDWKNLHRLTIASTLGSASKNHQSLLPKSNFKGTARGPGWHQFNNVMGHVYGELPSSERALSGIIFEGGIKRYVYASIVEDETDETVHYLYLLRDPDVCCKLSISKDQFDVIQALDTMPSATRPAPAPRGHVQSTQSWPYVRPRFTPDPLVTVPPPPEPHGHKLEVISYLPTPFSHKVDVNPILTQAVHAIRCDCTATYFCGTVMNKFYKKQEHYLWRQKVTERQFGPKANQEGIANTTSLAVPIPSTKLLFPFTVQLHQVREWDGSIVQKLLPVVEKDGYCFSFYDKPSGVRTVTHKMTSDILEYIKGLTDFDGWEKVYELCEKFISGRGKSPIPCANANHNYGNTERIWRKNPDGSEPPSYEAANELALSNLLFGMCTACYQDSTSIGHDILF